MISSTFNIQSFLNYLTAEKTVNIFKSTFLNRTAPAAASVF